MANYNVLDNKENNVLSGEVRSLQGLGRVKDLVGMGALFAGRGVNIGNLYQGSTRVVIVQALVYYSTTHPS
jgi:hypothetical protein